MIRMAITGMGRPVMAAAVVALTAIVRGAARAVNAA